jgi:hypothetical protein
MSSVTNRSSALPERKVNPMNGLQHLRSVRDILSTVDPWTESVLSARLADYAATEADGNLRAVADPIRIALSGMGIGLPIVELLVLVGRSESIRRIDKTVALTDRLLRAA